MKLNASIIVIGLSGILLVGSLGTTVAIAEDMPDFIGSRIIKDDSVRSVDLQDGSARSIDIQDGGIRLRDISDEAEEKLTNRAGPQGPQGPQGPEGPQGPAGPAGEDLTWEGAVWRSLTYTNGGGGSATVACADTQEESMEYTAVAGGVQGDTVADQGEDGFAITASFPGRMNWDTGQPREGRLDGWIILGNGEYTETLTVWALCVPTTDIALDQDSLDN